MCVIIDTNVAAILLVDRHPDFDPIWQALREKRARMVYSPQLTREYQRNRSVIAVVSQLTRAGAARLVPAADVAKQIDALVSEGHCVSNDVHIVAIARVGSVRLLCSRDQALHADFTNPIILNNPRGSIYQNASHQHLIREHCGSRP